MMSRIQIPGVHRDRSHSRLSLTPSVALLVLPVAIGVAVYEFGIPLEPDASYYVGGLSLFPSPLGTLLGTAGGYPGLALLNGFAAFAIILLVGLIASDLGGHAFAAQILALLIARGEWFTSWGMDSPAVALLLAAALLHVRGRSRWAIVLVGLAAATHLAALPLALGVLALHARRRGTMTVVIGLAAAGALVAWFTGYRAGIPSSARTRCTHRGGTRTAIGLLASCDPRLRRDVPSPRTTAVHRVSRRGDSRRCYSRFGRSAGFDAIRDSVRFHRGCRSPAPRLTRRGTRNGTRPSPVGTVSAREASGFTLIKLLIVLVIIGILLGIAGPSYLGFKDRANKAAAQANVRLRRERKVLRTRYRPRRHHHC